MQKRIEILAELTKSGKMYLEPVPTEFDRKDLFLSPLKMESKRVNEYILNQEPKILPECALAGFLKFNGTVRGDIFNRPGHPHFAALMKNFYMKPIDNTATFEWQHSTGDFEKIIRGGISEVKVKIAESMKAHADDAEAIEYLETQADFCDTVIKWAHKCADRALAVAEQTDVDEYKANLTKLAKALHRIPEYPAESFYEAVLAIYISYPFVPDSIGLVDRYLYPFYIKDRANGILTNEEATAYLQELFLMLQSRIPPTSDRFYRGGESHFAVGGYLPNGEDGFNELSHLVVDALMELPTWIPQISLRWTEKTPREVLRYMMDCERKDPNKRIAFVNDEPRIKAYMENAGFTYEEAVSYIMVGCNEPAFPGGLYFGTAKHNGIKSIVSTFTERSDEITRASDFDEFYKIFESELFGFLEAGIGDEDAFNIARSRDTNIISNIYFNGCTEAAKDVTKGSARVAINGFGITGITNVIDSLCAVKQFVYEEKLVTMSELTAALNADWVGFEELHTVIKKRGKFFGNDDELSNGVARRFTESLYMFFKDRRSVFGFPFLVGDLVGYNEHHKWFGEGSMATPDGRHAGEPLKFGRGQSGGYDREGLTALLNSVAKCDPYHIITGPTVTNVMLDERLVTDEGDFERLVDLFETYFKNGGIHFQLAYVSKEDLIAAQKDPDKYRSLRVRVSGFSDYFVFLNAGLQDDIIKRTVKIC